MTDETLCFRSYCRSVAALLERDYALTLADAGLEHSHLALAFADGEQPAAFVAWFARKHGLTHADDWSLEQGRRLLGSIAEEGEGTGET